MLLDLLPAIGHLLQPLGGHEDDTGQFKCPVHSLSPQLGHGRSGLPLLNLVRYLVPQLRQVMLLISVATVLSPWKDQSSLCF